MRSGDCALCRVTSVVCFWGELTPYARWKRPALAVMSAIILAAACAPWYLDSWQGGWLLAVLSISLGVAALLGTAAAFFGCDRCVVRSWGHL